LLTWLNSITNNRSDSYSPSIVLSNRALHINSSVDDSINNALNFNFTRVVHDSDSELEAEESKISFILPNSSKFSIFRLL